MLSLLYMLLFLVVQLEKAEKERMKRVVLNIHERQEEEDYQGCDWSLVIWLSDIVSI